MTPNHSTGFVSTAPVAAPDQPHANVARLRSVSPLNPASGDAFSLVLANDGDGWVGTFGVLLAALLTDLVPEGALEASVAYLDDEETDAVRTGWIVGFDPASHRIDWADGTVTDANMVLAIGI